MYQLLIVDDEPLVQAGIRSMLNWNEMNIEICGTAMNGQAALKIIEEKSTDIVITDIKMPVMNGLELAKTCRERYGDNCPYFIILTSYEDFQMARDALSYQVSDYLVTEPYGGVEQDVFLNGALKLRTLLTPEELLDRLHELEQAAHRERIVHWGPRTLDLDILLYDQMIIDTPVLHVPHIDMENRDFVLIPLTELAPYYRHPVLNKTISQLLKELQAK